MKVIHVFSFNLNDHTNYLVKSFKDAHIANFDSEQKISILSNSGRTLGQFSIDKFYCIEEDLEEKD